MANRKKSKKHARKSRTRRSTRRKKTEADAGGAALAAESTVFMEEEAPPVLGEAFTKSLAHPLAPALPAPKHSESAPIVKHAAPSAHALMRHDSRPAPLPPRERSPKPARSPRPKPASKPLPEKLTQAQIYETLAALLVPYARKMESEMHPKIGFCLKARSSRTGRETHFGGVQALDDGVAYHLFPLYGHPDLLEGVSPELFNRLRGKTCFHFDALTAGLVAELTELTHAGFERFLSDGVF